VCVRPKLEVIGVLLGLWIVNCAAAMRHGDTPSLLRATRPENGSTYTNVSSVMRLFKSRTAPYCGITCACATGRQPRRVRPPTTWRTPTPKLRSRCSG
jgi:hypothetical protein